METYCKSDDSKILTKLIYLCLIVLLRVTGSHDRTLRIWNTCNWLCQRVIIAHDCKANSTRSEIRLIILFIAYINCLDSDGMHCVSGSSDRYCVVHWIYKCCTLKSKHLKRLVTDLEFGVLVHRRAHSVSFDARM